jgi:hypothetical protein
MARITISRYKRAGSNLIWQLFFFVLTILMIAAFIARQHAPIKSQGIGNVTMELPLKK